VPKNERKGILAKEKPANGDWPRRGQRKQCIMGTHNIEENSAARKPKRDEIVGPFAANYSLLFRPARLFHRAVKSKRAVKPPASKLMTVG
jgi:hypothetical protein